MPMGLTDDCSVIDAELDRGFDRRDSERSLRALQHLRVCDRCRKLYECVTEAPPPGTPSTEVNERILTIIRSSLTPVSPRPSTLGLTVRLLGIFLLVVLPPIGLTPVAGLHEMKLSQSIGFSAILALGAALLSLSLAWQMTPGAFHRVPPKAAPLFLVAGFLMGIVALFPWRAPEAFLATGWPCLKAGFLIALPAAALFWLLIRRGTALNMGILGASLGGFAGLAGATVLQFTCSLQEAGHLLLWHGGVLAGSAVVGAFIARLVKSLTRPRP